MKKIVFLLIFPLLSLFPADREYEIGNKFWDLSGSSSIEQTVNMNKSLSLSLRESEYQPDSKTLILLHFNEEAEFDATGRCKAENLSVSEKIRKLGRGSGIFNSGQNPLILDTMGKSFFPDKVYSGDFSVEFWMYSLNASDGETYFLYENYTDSGSRILPQQFRCYLEDRKVLWEIKNLFLPYDKNPFSVSVMGKKRIIPKQWSHHLLRYRADTGLLEYLIDGVPEAVKYINREGKEEGGTYPFYAGANSRIEMGENFTGALDEFRIKGEWIEDYSLSRIGRLTGFFRTGLIDLKHSKSEIFQVDFKDSIPPGTDVKYYYVLSNSPDPPDTVSKSWRELPEGKVRISGGRFLYIKGILYADGEKNISPSVNSIKLKYDERSAPPPPSSVKAEIFDRKLKLRWSAVPDSDIDGYLVYIGDKPGRYFGTESGSIKSPIDAGLKNSIEINNLENGKIYYISVISYYETASLIGSIIKKGGNYSKEISVRPSAGSR